MNFPVFSDHLLRLAWSLPLALPLIVPPRRTVSVLYHGVPSAPGATMSASVFERHLQFLKHHFDLVSPNDDSLSGTGFGRRRVLLTFDDGFRNNAEVVVPILRKYEVPAIFFICSRHAVPGKYLWFSYLRGLEHNFPGKRLAFRGRDYDMSADARHQSLKRLRQTLLALTPHPTAMYQAIENELPRLEDFVSGRELADEYAGMSAAQVAELASDPLFDVGVHTTDHPFLDRCEPGEARRQIDDNRRWIENATGRPCNVVAYPAGEYNTTVLRMCEEMGFKRGFAVAARFGGNSHLELSRMGIYSESTDILGFKVQWGHLLRQVRIPIG